MPAASVVLTTLLLVVAASWALGDRRRGLPLRSLLRSPTMVLAYVAALVFGAYVSAEARTQVGPRCRENGECDWLFHTTTDADCRAAPRACMGSGRCYADGGRCVALGEEDCQVSASCVDKGYCALVGGECRRRADVVTDGHCDWQTWLQERGATKCRFEGERCEGAVQAACMKWKIPEDTRPNRCLGFECAPTCAETGACRVFGQCAPGEEGMCVATQEGCAASEACRTRGACSLRNGRCQPSLDGSDCQKSEVCARNGWCSPTAYENGADRYMGVCFDGAETWSGAALR